MRFGYRDNDSQIKEDQHGVLKVADCNHVDFDLFDDPSSKPQHFSALLRELERRSAPAFLKGSDTLLHHHLDQSHEQLRVKVRDILTNERRFFECDRTVRLHGKCLGNVSSKRNTMLLFAEIQNYVLLFVLCASPSESR